MVLMIIPYKDRDKETRERLLELLPSNYCIEIKEFLDIGKAIVVTLKEGWEEETEYGRTIRVYNIEKIKDKISFDEAFKFSKTIVCNTLVTGIGMVLITLAPFYYPWGPGHFNDPEFIRGFWINTQVLNEEDESIWFILNSLKGCLGIHVIEPPISPSLIFKTYLSKYKQYLTHCNEWFYISCKRSCKRE